MIPIIVLAELLQAFDEEPKKMHVTQEIFDKNIGVLAGKIHESKFSFDSIVAIIRGGVFVADPLTRIFKAKELCSISAKSYKGEQQGELEHSGVATIYGLGKKVLLVDDLVDSGDTMFKLTELLKVKYGVEEVKTAVMYKKTCSKVKPDFCAEIVGRKTWIVFPYEKYDDVLPENLNK